MTESEGYIDTNAHLRARVAVLEQELAAANDYISKWKSLADANAHVAEVVQKRAERLAAELAAAQARERLLREALTEIASAKGFDNIGAWARNRARAELLARSDDTILREMIEAARKGEREACLACYSPDDTATDWADKIRARKG